MGFIDNKQGAFIVEIDAIKDLNLHPIYTQAGVFH